MKKIVWILLLNLICFFPIKSLAESSEGIHLLKAPINTNDVLSLQRGAKLYVNYCASCHSLRFMRYNDMAMDAKIFDEKGNLNESLVKNHFIFTGAKISDVLRVAMQSDNAKEWFGVAPPDLSVIAKARGVDWLYTYLLSFYRDSSRPLGVNNLLFNETAMPDVLVNLRGVQVPIYRDETVKIGDSSQIVRHIERLNLDEQGTMSSAQFNATVADIVNFLAYVAEPTKHQRQTLGYWVLGFLLVFAMFAYLLKREYWRDVH